MSESRSELGVSRNVRIVDSAFLPRIAGIANEIFVNEEGGDLLTLRPPLTERSISRYVSNSVVKIYDLDNLRFHHIQKISTGQKGAADKFNRARRLLQNGIFEKPQLRKGEERRHKQEPLSTIFDLIELEHGHEAGQQIEIVGHQIGAQSNPRLFNGSLELTLELDPKDYNFDMLRKQSASADEALLAANVFLGNPTQPSSMQVPFMRIGTHPLQQRIDFLKYIESQRLLPVSLILGPMAIRSGSENT